jgi:AbrB family looped-hinge helix DNA binding protein
MASLTLSANGRILIPSALRDQLGFKPCGKIFVEVKDGALVLTPAALHNARLRTYFDQHLNPKGSVNSVDEFIAERRAEEKREDAQ